MSVRRRIADFFSLTQGAVGARTALSAGAIALGVIAATSAMAYDDVCYWDEHVDQAYADHTNQHTNYDDTHLDSHNEEYYCL